jgi:hypothetical protein
VRYWLTIALRLVPFALGWLISAPKRYEYSQAWLKCNLSRAMLCHNRSVKRHVFVNFIALLTPQLTAYAKKLRAYLPRPTLVTLFPNVSILKPRDSQFDLQSDDGSQCGHQVALARGFRGIPCLRSVFYRKYRTHQYFLTYC